MPKYEKGQYVSYKSTSTYLGKTYGNSKGMGKLSNSGSGVITSVQKNTVRVSNPDGSSSTILKSRIC